MSVLRIERHTDLEATKLEELWPQFETRSALRSVFQSLAWNRSWWRAMGRGQLILLSAWRDAEPCVLAPLYADSGMLYVIGSGSSDYLDLIGATHDDDAVLALLSEARQLTPGFVGSLFYHLPVESHTPTALRHIAPQLKLQLVEEWHGTAPRVDPLTPEIAEQLRSKQSLKRSSQKLSRHGELEVETLLSAAEVLPLLGDFFEQHTARWAAKDLKSLFLDNQQRELYRELTKSLSKDGSLRFTRVLLDGRPIAYHFGFLYAGSFLWYKPSFEIELARLSPGEVLLRSLLDLAATEQATSFDFGLGDEAFKARFANCERAVVNLGLYPGVSA